MTTLLHNRLWSNGRGNLAVTYRINAGHKVFIEEQELFSSFLLFKKKRQP